MTPGSAAVVTSNTGIIRPRVRASSGGSAKALGAVSLVIAAQIPPVAMVSATPNEGVLWRPPEMLSVTFDASESYDQDGPSLEYAFDPLGDGVFTVWGASDSATCTITLRAEPIWLPYGCATRMT